METMGNGQNTNLLGGGGGELQFLHIRLASDLFTMINKFFLSLLKYLHTIASKKKCYTETGKEYFPWGVLEHKVTLCDFE